MASLILEKIGQSQVTDYRANGCRGNNFIFDEDEYCVSPLHSGFVSDEHDANALSTISPKKLLAVSLCTVGCDAKRLICYEVTYSCETATERAYGSVLSN